MAAAKEQWTLCEATLKKNTSKSISILTEKFIHWLSNICQTNAKLAEYFQITDPVPSKPSLK